MKLPRHLLTFDCIDSTQRVAAGQPLGTMVVANSQFMGKGRHGHTWHSEAGTGIYCSIVLKPAALLTLALGVATVDAIARATGIVCDLRWPNDLMLDGLKAGGILVELVNGKAVCGIGINVNQTSFPEGLEATSLRLHANRAFDREDILAALPSAIETALDQDSEAILRLFAQASSYAAGRRVHVEQPGGLIEGITAGLTDDGYLIVRQDDGTDTLIVAGGVRAAGA